MADQQGPSLNIPFDSRNLEQLRRFQDAAKRAKAEAAAMRKEFAAAAKEGREIDKASITRLRNLENIERKAKEVVAREKEGAVARKEALRLAERERAVSVRGQADLARAGRFTRRLATSTAMHTLFSGGSASDAFHDPRMLTDTFLLGGASRGIRRAGVALGSRTLGSVGRGIGALAGSPVGLLAAQMTVDQIQKFIQENADRGKGNAQINRMVGSGQMSAAEGRLYDKSVQGIAAGGFGNTADALELLTESQKAGRALYTGKVTSKDVNVAIGERDSAIRQAGVEPPKGDAEKINKVYGDMKAAIKQGVRDKTLKLGRTLSGDEEQRAINEATAKYLENLPPMVAEKIVKSINELADKAASEKNAKGLTPAQQLNERFSGEIESFNAHQRARKAMEELGAPGFIPGTTQRQGGKTAGKVSAAEHAAANEKAGAKDAWEGKVTLLVTKDGHDD